MRSKMYKINKDLQSLVYFVQFGFAKLQSSAPVCALGHLLSKGGFSFLYPLILFLFVKIIIHRLSSIFRHDLLELLQGRGLDGFHRLEVL